MIEVRLRRGRAKPIWAGHPSLLSGSVESVSGDPGPGEVVLVVDHDGRPIGRGFFAPESPIRVRMLTRDPGEEIDAGFLRRRIESAVALRRTLGLPGADTDAYRLVHGDGDGLPGVVVDCYGPIAVVQLTVRGMEDLRHEIAAALADTAGVESVLLRRVRSFEKAEALTGAEGVLLGGPIPDDVEVREGGVRFVVAPAVGQKTGHFLDHRENRALLARFVPGRTVLDAFTGTGGFALHAAVSGAKEVTAIDSSVPALAAAERNAVRNGVADRVSFVKDDVFRALRRYEDEGRTFDVVVLDPPRMASKQRDLKRARRGYKELNLRALKLTRDGGVLATASCTGLLSEEDFERQIRAAALDASREYVVLHRRGQAPDHPWSITCPESRYLKFLLGRVRGVLPTPGRSPGQRS